MYSFGSLSYRLSSLSFYKETQAGETDNYIHMRASAEHKPVAVIFREIVEDNIQSWCTVKQIASVQPDLANICVGHLMVRFRTLHFWHGRRVKMLIVWNIYRVMWSFTSKHAANTAYRKLWVNHDSFRYAFSCEGDYGVVSYYKDTRKCLTVLVPPPGPAVAIVDEHMSATRIATMLPLSGGGATRRTVHY